MTDGPMGDYEMDLIRHLVGKALVESDELDIESMDPEDIETALWGVKAEVALGVYGKHPKEKEVYKHREESTLED